MKSILKIIKFLLLGSAILLGTILIFFGYTDIPIEDLTLKYGEEPSKFVEVDGMNVHFRDEGTSSDSLPIVLIHGTGSSLHTFNGWTAKLKQKHRIIRMDLPAYGLTGAFPSRDYSMKNYVLFMKRFLKALDIPKCVLGGNSLGGGIAWNFAVDYPEMVDKLILIDASGYPTEAKSIPLAFKIAQTPIINTLFTFITPRFIAKKSVENVYADKSKVSEALVDRYFQLTLRKGNRQAFIDKLTAHKTPSRYQKIKCLKQKTLVIWGEKDELIPPEAAYKFDADLPNSTVVILEGLGHVPMEENPTASLAPVILFLKSE
jgi:pimeloyl-ACP methyl ester carboxylesterase